MLNHLTAQSLRPGSVLFDRFELVARLGEGGFGTVWRAHDKHVWRDVALKVLSRVELSARVRFKREFRVARRFAHPNLVQLGELFGTDDLWAFSMELIEGVDLLDWLRERPPTAAGDEEAVRECLAQLASGLAALHRVGVVHRDIKPSNVLVTHQGRVVIVDFGLLSSRGEVSESNGQYAVGTFAYMAPEQAQGAASSASDMYAVGVVLYEALTGQLPFDDENESRQSEFVETQLGRAMRMAFFKLSHLLPPAPKVLLESISDELSDLALQLLSISPNQRPTASALLKQLDRGSEPAATQPGLPNAPFVGRKGHIDDLMALLTAKRDWPQLVLLEGAPGVGKSTLLAQFLARTKQSAQPPLILSGRCHAFEHVRYNAFDEIFAQLARLAGSRMADDAQPRVAALAQFITALNPSIRQPPESSQRSRLFDSVLGAITYLRKDRRVILALDDLQWADRDSLSLLSHLLTSRGYDWLIVAAQRGSTTDVATSLSLKRIDVGMLPQAEAQELAASLLGTQNAAMPRVLDQAAGHPLYLQELALLSDQPEALDGVLSLERAIAWRMSALEPQARRALVVVCVAGTPLSYGVLAMAAELERSGGVLYRVLSLLQDRRLVLAGSRDATAWPYHDRVRETVVAQLDAADLKRTHLALAAAWKSAAVCNPENVARHYLAAGEHVSALGPMREAAKQAFDKAAYARVIDLCSRWLEIGDRPESREHRFEMVVMYSDALAFTGAYSQSAEVLQSTGADAARNERDRRELLIRSAERLLQSAAVLDGVSAATLALGAVGLVLPRSEVELVTALAKSQLRVRLQRIKRPQVEALPDHTLVEQLDTLWRLTQPLYFADLARSTLTGAHHFWLAGKVGDRGHLILSCAANSVMEATRDPESARSKALIDHAESLCKETTAASSTRAYVAFARGARALFSGNTQEAIFSLKDADLIYRKHCPDQAWLQTTARGSYLRALFFRGRHRFFYNFANEWTRDARLRSDKAGFAQYAILGQAALRHLMRDRPDEALEELEKALQPWSETRLGIVQWLYLLTCTTVVSYSPFSVDRKSFEERIGFPLRTLRLIKVVPAGILMCDVLANTAWTLSQPALVRVSTQLVRKARKVATNNGPPWAKAMGSLALAQLLIVNQHASDARDHAQEASRVFSQLGYQLYGQAADILVAVTESTDPPLTHCNALRTRLKALGWENLDEALGCYLPITRYWNLTAKKSGAGSRAHPPAPSVTAASAYGS